MKKKLTSKSAFFNRRFLISFALCSVGIVLALVAFALYPGGNVRAQGGLQPSQPAQAPLLTPEETQRVAEGIKQLVSQSTEGLVEVRHPNGAASVDLEGRFQNVTVAKKEANGSITQACLDNPDSAAAFFKIDPKLVGAKTQPVLDQLEER